MNKLLVDACDTVLRAAGFRKKSSSWYRDTPDTILVVNLQHSSYGEQYYLNLAIWVKALGTDSQPKENLCHIRTRLGTLAGIETDSWLNLESPSTDDERFPQIQHALVSHAIPFLNACSTYDGIRQSLNSGNLKAAFVHLAVKQLLAQSH